MKVRRNILVVFVFTLISIALLMGLSSRPARAQKPIEWKMLVSWGLEVPTTRYFVPPFVEEVNKRCAGRLKVSWYGPESVPPWEQLKPTRTGLFDVLYTHSAYHSGEVAVGQAMDFIYATGKERRDAGLYKIVDEAYREKANVTYLGGMSLGTGYHTFFREKITKADFTGLKIRTSPFYDPMIRSLGGSPVRIAYGEIYSALEKGVVDGAAWSANGILDSKWYEAAKYFLRPTFGDPVSPLLVNVDSWNRLPKDLQNILTQVTMEMEEQFRAEMIRQFENEEKELKKLGVEYVVLPPKEAEKYLNAFYNEYDELITKHDPVYGPRMKAVIDKMRK